VKYRDYFLEFGLLLRDRGFSHGSCQIEEPILDRLLKGDYKSFKLKSQHEIDKMTGVEFEIFLARFFHRCGYNVERTPVSYDIGADLIIHLYGIKTVVQAK
jgi:HJR/Mrr/RecB family endonuclease